MAAQGENSSTWSAYVAQEQLDDGCRTDELDAYGVLSPTNRIDDGGGSLAA
jgi:hypothetical protein